MAIWNNFEIIERAELEASYKNLVEKAKLDFDYAFLSLAGLATCVLGLSVNSSPIVIGAMIIAPLLNSVLVLPAALVWKDRRLFLKNLRNLLIELIVGVIFCLLLAYILGINLQEMDLVSALGQNIFIYFLVATIAGSSAALSLFWPSVSEQLTGVAVSVALVPPIAIMGISLASGSKGILLNATANLFLNLTGIIIGAYLILKFIKNRSD